MQSNNKIKKLSNIKCKITIILTTASSPSGRPLDPRCKEPPGLKIREHRNQRRLKICLGGGGGTNPHSPSLEGGGGHGPAPPSHRTPGGRLATSWGTRWRRTSSGRRSSAASCPSTTTPPCPRPSCVSLPSRFITHRPSRHGNPPSGIAVEPPPPQVRAVETSSEDLWPWGVSIPNHDASMAPSRPSH